MPLGWFSSFQLFSGSKKQQQLFRAHDKHISIAAIFVVTPGICAQGAHPLLNSYALQESTA